MRNSKNRLIAAILLLLYSLINYDNIVADVEWLLDDGVDMWLMAYIAFDIAPILIAIGLFTNKPILAGCGSLLGTVYPILHLIDFIDWANANSDSWTSDVANNWRFIAFRVAWLLLYLFFAAGSFDKARGFLWMMLATAPVLTLLIVQTVNTNWDMSDALSILSTILLMAVMIILALGYQTKKQLAIVSANSIPQVASGVDTTIEKLTKLKQFLDDGIITQEEFDTKKKQLIGL